MKIDRAAAQRCAAIEKTEKFITALVSFLAVNRALALVANVGQPASDRQSLKA